MKATVVCFSRPLNAPGLLVQYLDPAGEQTLLTCMHALQAPLALSLFEQKCTLSGSL